MSQGRTALALTMGDPAGIGPEISLKAWLGRGDLELPPFFIIADPTLLAAEAGRMGLSVPLSVLSDASKAAAVFDRALPVLPAGMAVSAIPGRPDPANAVAVIESIRRAVRLTGEGMAGAVVTNPIAKKVLHEAGFTHPGHTEFLAELDGGARPVMMLACPGLRVVPLSIHIPLRKVAESLRREDILAQGRILDRALRRDFGLAAPRIAVAGLNPHAGEGGSMGDEEARIIAPAVADLCAEGINARGPLPADTLFHPAARAAHDAVLCMYHDQALIPLKMLDFAGGVNVTLGLSFIRTSPDHGTAFDIAGQGRADPSSLAAALRMAAQMVAARAGRAA